MNKKKYRWNKKVFVKNLGWFLLFAFLVNVPVLVFTFM